MNVRITVPAVAAAGCLTLTLLTGCADSSEAVTSDMHHDFDHEHEHQHDTHGDHEHHHDDHFEGKHSHQHTHGHRHGAPVHGGRVVSIGHTHHKQGVTHFHAEVMPLTDNTIHVHLLTENDQGELQDYSAQTKSIAGLISVTGKEAHSSEITFVPSADSKSGFTATIPEQLAKEHSFRVVIPSLKLDGQRQTFSFEVRRNPPSDAADTPTAVNKSIDPESTP